MKTPLQILIDARALIDSPEKWTRRVYRRESVDGCQYCALGAILYTCGQAELGPTESFLKRGAGITVIESITHWNDNANHDTVLRAFDTAIALARQAEAQP